MSTRADTLGQRLIWVADGLEICMGEKLYHVVLSCLVGPMAKTSLTGRDSMSWS